MSHVTRPIALLVTGLILTACGKGNLNSPYAYQQPYGQTSYGQMSYGQPGMQLVNGQYMPVQNNMMMQGSTQYAQTGANAQTPQATNLNAPIGGDYGYYGNTQAAAPGAQTAAPRAAVPSNSRPTPSLTKASAASSKAPVTKAPTTRAAAPKTTAPAPAAPKVADGAEFLAKARQAMASVQSLSATVSTFEKGATSGQGKIQYYYRNGQIKIDVIASSDASRKGVKLAFQSGGNQVKVRPSGVLSMVALNLSMSDGKLLSGRKYQLGQIDLSSTVNRLTQPGTQAKVLGKTSFGGSEVIVLEISSPNPFDNQITKEHLGLDAQNFLPRIHEMYVGQELVYAGRVEQLIVNPQLPDSTFNV